MKIIPAIGKYGMVRIVFYLKQQIASPSRLNLFFVRNDDRII
ncbi:hypothetical protein [Pedobacter nototheniae]|nr:hypothetical protein [Pedobacter nototheniae]